MVRPPLVGIMFTALSLVAQEPGLPDLQSLRQAAAAAQAGGAAAADATPRTAAARTTPEPVRPTQTEQDRIQAEIRAAKAKEKGPKRFAEDLFATRQASNTGTEGGISEDYVLGAGDQIQISAFGSANFELPATVDGRGELVVPKVGTVKVAGMSLAKARSAVQAKVAQQFSRTSVDLAVVKLREVRVFVLGEVYRPGGYLVPSLSSLVNVLGLAGGPTAAGSYRQIRVMRGGKVVHQVDLYPLRAEGLGNMNFGLQSGDTVFVPLAFNPVTLEGAFTRVVAATGDLEPRKVKTRQDKEIARLKEQIAAEEYRLGPKGSANRLHAEALLGERQGVDGLDPDEEQDKDKDEAKQKNKELDPEMAQERASAEGVGQALAVGPVPTQTTGYQEPSLAERTLINERLTLLRKRLDRLTLQARGDQRTQELTDQEALADGYSQENSGLPGWLVRWNTDGKAPSMQFEMLPGETAEQALRFAGGLALQAFDDGLVLRRMGKGGVLDAADVPLAKAGQVELRRGDVLSALASRERVEKTVTVSGWARVPGTFSRSEGLRVGDLLRRESQILPDTYMHRGEIVRTLPDQKTTYVAFDLAKALAGEPDHNLPLQDRDQIELYRVTDLRLPQTVQVRGPVSRPGTFPFHEGMRASDLLFQTGVLLNEADRLVAELAHTREGKPSEVRKLDLTRLLSNETSSPVRLDDEAVNPVLRPQDQISIYAKPDYRAHRSVTLIGQVARPGVYVLDSPRTGLREVLARAGGLTAEAMPQGSIFLRPMATPNADAFSLESQRANTKAPALNGINNILERLNETKRQPTTGVLLKTPILHGLGTGSLDRLVVNVPAILAGDTKLDVDLQDGDQIIVPRRTETAYVIGETASPFMSYHVVPGFKVKDMVKVAGGFTRNADESNIRLLKADGRILDRGIMGSEVEPGDAVLVPQKVRRDTSWQENLQAITPLALILNAIK